MSRLGRALLAARLAAVCQFRGHNYHTLYAGRGPGHKPIVSMQQCVRCGDFGGFSRIDEALMNYVIEVHAYDLTEAEVEDLFDRVADAAHAKDEQLFCFGHREDETAGR